jgi:hypothetical protein
MKESMIKDKLMKYLVENKLIQDSQHGFVPGKSCTTYLVELFDYVTKAKHDEQPVDIFYFLYLDGVS